MFCFYIVFSANVELKNVFDNLIEKSPKVSYMLLLLPCHRIQLGDGFHLVLLFSTIFVILEYSPFPIFCKFELLDFLIFFSIPCEENFFSLEIVGCYRVLLTICSFSSNIVCNILQFDLV